jgi:hypothetical protein
MVTQINPFHQHVWRSVSQLQIGLGTDGILLEDLTPHQERFIASLISGIADDQVESLSKQLKLEASEAHRIVATLKPVLLEQIMAEPATLDSMDGELVRATLIRNSDGFATLAKRNAKSVFISSLDRSGAIMANSLAQAQIGTIASDDLSKVTKSEIGTYLKSLENCARIAALDYQFRELGLATRVKNQTFEKASVSILIAQQCLLPKKYAPLMNRELPHIGVIFDHGGVTISPLIRPGETACLYCLEQNKARQDADWPVIASQLTTSRLAFNDSASNAFAAAAVTKIVTDWVDMGTSSDYGYRFDSRSGSVEPLEIEPNNGCDCLIQLRIKQGEKPGALAS